MKRETCSRLLQSILLSMQVNWRLPMFWIFAVMSYYNKELFRWSRLAILQLQKCYNLDTDFLFHSTPAQCKTSPWGHEMVQIKSNNNSYRTKGFRVPPQLPNPILPRRKSFALCQRHVNPKPLKATRLTSSPPYSELQFLFLVLCDLQLCSWEVALSARKKWSLTNTCGYLKKRYSVSLL